MKLKPDSTATKILQMLKTTPMTVPQLADAFAQADDYIRVIVSRLEVGGFVRRKGFGERSRSGATPYVWEAV